jgi:hypothetical protein
LLFSFFSDRYLPRYIYTRFKKLSPNSIIPLIANQNDVLFVRSYILNRTTATEYEITSRIAKTIDPFKNDRINDSLVRMRLNKVPKSDRNLIIHNTHEARLGTYKKHIHQLWDQIFADTPVTNTKLIVGNRNSCNTTNILWMKEIRVTYSHFFCRSVIRARYVYAREFVFVRI